jgi:hypothetical protein
VVKVFFVDASSLVFHLQNNFYLVTVSAGPDNCRKKCDYSVFRTELGSVAKQVDKYLLGSLRVHEVVRRLVTRLGVV